MRWRQIVIVATVVLTSLTSAASAGELSGGGWRGSWVDNNTGHEGPLRARFRATDDCHYRVVFTGRFFKVIPFRFATTLKVVERDGARVVLAGESRVAGFGRFSYNGMADSNNFSADYQSRRWTGTFQLQR